MKDLSAVLLAAFLVLISLMSLIFGARSPEATSPAPMIDEGRVSDVGLRFALKR